MYDKISGKIKLLAKISFWAQIAIAIIVAINAIIERDMSGLVAALVYATFAIVSTWLIYGFGEIIEKLCDIERNTRNGYVESEMESQVNYERIKKIENLRAQDLITEEEYQMVMSKYI